MIVTREPNIYSFTGNPILFELEVETADLLQTEIIVNGQSRSNSFYPYMQNGKYKIRIEISDYLIREYHPLDIPLGDIISPLVDFWLPFQLKIGSDYSFEGYAFQGGIPNRDYKILSEKGFDIFTYRLGSHFDQFLFTTRTHSKEIRIRETEIYPFVFINHGLDFTFRSKSGYTIEVPSDTTSPICILDIQALRKSFLLLYNDIANSIEVLLADEVSFKIEIEAGHISDEKYLIRFRNSLGTYEVIEVVGKAIHSPALSEENNYSVYTDNDFFEERRNRIASKGVIEVETGYKKRWELPFIMDMIKSDEIYFIYPDQTSFRCHVNAEEVKYHHKMTTPTSIPLIITEVTDEIYISPQLDTDLLYSSIGIFDEEFDLTHE